MFLGREAGEEPEKGSRHKGPHGKEHDGLDMAFDGDITTNDDIDAEDDIRCRCRQMPYCNSFTDSHPYRP